MLLDVYQHNVNSKFFAINVPEHYFRVFLKRYVLRPYVDTVLKIVCIWTTLSASVEFNICLACGKCHTSHREVLEEMDRLFEHVASDMWFSTLERVIFDKMSLRHVVGMKLVNVTNNFNLSIASRNTFVDDDDGQEDVQLLPGPLFHVLEEKKFDTETETDLRKWMMMKTTGRLVVELLRDDDDGPPGYTNTTTTTTTTTTCDMPYCEWLARRANVQGLLSTKVVPEWKAEGFYGHFMLRPDPFLQTAHDDNVERGGMIGLSVRSLNMMSKFLGDWRDTHDWHHVLVKARAWHVFRREMLAMRAAADGDGDDDDVHVIYYSCLCDGTKNLKREDVDLVVHRHMIIASSKTSGFNRVWKNKIKLKGCRNQDIKVKKQIETLDQLERTLGHVTTPTRQCDGRRILI